MEVKRNIIIGKVGGNANENSVNYKISLPAKMVKDLGVTKEGRAVSNYINFLIDKEIKKNQEK